MKNKIEPRYLGDGVYASFDGYHINLAVNSDTNHVVALEPEVMNGLKQFEKDIYKKINNEENRD